MKEIQNNTSEIHDWPSFHKIFQVTFGFPDYYGANMDAWIDCMSCLNDPLSGMSKITLEPGESLTIKLLQTKDFMIRCPKLFMSFVECSAFVNQRYPEPLL
jgi:hypothetical protein